MSLAGRGSHCWASDGSVQLGSHTLASAGRQIVRVWGRAGSGALLREGVEGRVRGSPGQGWRDLGHSRAPSRVSSSQTAAPVSAQLLSS